MDFDVSVRVTGYSRPNGVGMEVSSAVKDFVGSPDGCNHFEVEL